MKESKEIIKEPMKTKILDTPAGKLEVFSLHNNNAIEQEVLVLPNGYGALEYCKTLGGRLSERWSNITIPNLRGQGQSDGELSIKGGANDVEYLCKEIKSSSGKKITIIVHCSAIFYILSLTKKQEFWINIEKIILYGYLAAPADHIDRFTKKAKKYGVKVHVTRDEVTRFTPSIYSEIPVPFYVVHPLSGINLSRANKIQLDELNIKGNPKLILTPEKGYEILDLGQNAMTSSIVINCFNPILNNNIKSIRTEIGTS